MSYTQTGAMQAAAALATAAQLAVTLDPAAGPLHQAAVQALATELSQHQQYSGANQLEQYSGAGQQYSGANQQYTGANQSMQQQQQQLEQQRQLIALGAQQQGYGFAAPQMQQAAGWGQQTQQAGGGCRSLFTCVSHPSLQSTLKARAHAVI